MTSDEDVEKAISVLNCAELIGRPLIVNKARPGQALSNSNRGSFRDRQKKSHGKGTGAANWR
jgi:hypothetical protein